MLTLNQRQDLQSYFPRLESCESWATCDGDGRTYWESLDCVEDFVQKRIDELTRDDHSAHPYHEELRTICKLIIVVHWDRVSSVRSSIKKDLPSVNLMSSGCSSKHQYDTRLCRQYDAP